MKPSAASACTSVLIDSAIVAADPTKVWSAVALMISSRIDRFLARASSRHCRAVASGSRNCRTLARPRAMVFSPTRGSTSGSGPSGS